MIALLVRRGDAALADGDIGWGSPGCLNARPGWVRLPLRLAPARPMTLSFCREPARAASGRISRHRLVSQGRAFWVIGRPRSGWRGLKRGGREQEANELPNIEDAALRECLAPLMEAMNAGERPRESGGSNDNPAPANDPNDNFGTPETLTEWKVVADDDFLGCSARSSCFWPCDGRGTGNRGGGVSQTDRRNNRADWPT